ncbi:MAG: DUF1887 family protein [Muribaculaceae bacterium]|nr:DUF1887 family protein [Muribaculaceae bacterium]
MSKVFITLVGGQAIPAYQGVKYSESFKPDKVVLVHSDSSKEEADRVKIAVKDNYGNNVEFDYCMISPIDFGKIKSGAEKIKNKYIDDEVVVNITGGLKPWSIFFYNVFLSHPKATIVYVSQTNETINLSDNKTRDVKIDPKLRLKLCGVELDTFKNNFFSDYTEEDFNVIKTIEEIRRINLFHFFNLTDVNGSVERDISKKYSNETPDNQTSDLVYNHAKSSATIDIYNRKNNSRDHYTLKSPHLAQILFNNAWFELKTALAISKIPGVGEIWLNCIFLADKENPDSALNEIDVIAEFNGRFVCVECKTFPYDTTDIDKFTSAIYNFCGDSAICIFAVNDLPWNPKKKSDYLRAKNKCKDNNITIYNFSDMHSNLAKVVKKLLNRQNK